MPSHSLIDRLRDYAVLPPEERAALDAEAASDPDVADAWAEAKALAALTEAARASEDLAARVVDEHLGYGTIVGDLEAAALRSEVARLGTEAEDPAAQFERLTGHTLPDSSPPVSSDGSIGRPPRLATDRPAAHGAPTRRRVRGLAYALVGLLAVYGMAFAGSSLATPERARVAHVSDVSDSFRPTRGAEIMDRYAEAVDLLESARRSTLGLFPRYDEATLEQAAEAFTSIARETPDDHFGKEATLALGRIRVLQGRDEDARLALDAVMAQGGHRAPDAARLLDYLDAQAR